MAAGIGIALPLVAWLGFDPAARANTPAALRDLALVFALCPAIAHALAALPVWRFPIDQMRYEAIRQALAARDAGTPGA